MAKKASDRKYLSLGTLEDFELKKLEVEQRLLKAKVFIAFISNPSDADKYFITGSNVPPSLFGNSNFRLIVAGSSLAELSYAEGLFREISSEIASNFSKMDLHSTIVLEFLSKCFKEDLEDMRCPLGHAIECAIVDVRGYLMRINFDGEMKVDHFKETEEMVFLSGIYEDKFKKGLMADLKKAPKKVNEIEMVKFAGWLKKKYGIPHVGYIK